MWNWVVRYIVLGLAIAAGFILLYTGGCRFFVGYDMSKPPLEVVEFLDYLQAKNYPPLQSRIAPFEVSKIRFDEFLAFVQDAVHEYGDMQSYRIDHCINQRATDGACIVVTGMVKHEFCDLILKMTLRKTGGACLVQEFRLTPDFDFFTDTVRVQVTQTADLFFETMIQKDYQKLCGMSGKENSFADSPSRMQEWLEHLFSGFGAVESAKIDEVFPLRRDLCGINGTMELEFGHAEFRMACRIRDGKREITGFHFRNPKPR